jgi:hypothetical protein
MLPGRLSQPIHGCFSISREPDTYDAMKMTKEEITTYLPVCHVHPHGPRRDIVHVENGMFQSV